MFSFKKYFSQIFEGLCVLILFLFFMAAIIMLIVGIGKGQVIQPCISYIPTFKSLYNDNDNFKPYEALSQVHIESHCRPNVSSKYAHGLAQFTPPTAGDIYPLVNCDPKDIFNEICSLKAQRLYMNRLYKTLDARTDDTKPFALASYNGGYGWIRKEINECKKEPNCNPRKWYRNVEKTCIRAPWACRENRLYPIKITNLYPTYKGVF